MRYIFPTIAGVFATIAAGYILGQIFLFILDNINIEWLNLFGGQSQTDRIITHMVFIIWLFLITLFGGFICVFLVDEKEDFALFLTMCAVYLAARLFYHFNFRSVDGDEAGMILLTSVCGYITGGWICMRRKKKKQTTRNSTNPNS